MLANTILFSDSTLQAYYKLEDVTDSKNSNTMTNNGSTPFNPAKFNNGMDQGTSNSTKWLSIANRLGYTGGAYSIAGWIKVNTAPSSGSNNVFFAVGDSVTKTSLNVGYKNNAGTLQIVFDYVRLGASDTLATVNIDLGTSAFHHVVLIYDTVNIYGYVDNVVVPGTAASGVGSTVVNDAATLGADKDTNQKSSMIIDDVGFFSKVLSATEVNILFNDIRPSGLLFSDI